MDFKKNSESAQKIINLSNQLQEVFCMEVDEAYRIAIIAGLTDAHNFHEMLKKLD